METHRLDPLLRPSSVAVVGASSRTDSLGEWALRNLIKGGFQGRLYPVNPNYEELQGKRCYASLAALPEAPDLVVFAVADTRLEAALDDAIARGVKAVVIQSTLVIDDDVAPPLKERVQQKLNDAGLLACGANGMGYYNARDHVWTCGFDSAMHTVPGNVTIISHSGAGMSGVIDCEQRLRINLAVSTGNELVTTMDEYLDFALDLPETRVVGLFIETARNPDGFRAALEKAARRRIPIIALKVGRTAQAARLTVSHSGALAGDDATYEALFDRYGVQRARDQDEWVAMLILFAELSPVGDGGLVALHDSGGEAQLLVDMADDLQVPLTVLSDATVSEIEKVVDQEVLTVNPLDAWSRGGPDAAAQMTRALSLMMQDPGAAIGAVMHNRAPEGLIYSSYIGYMQRARAESGKPVVLVSATPGSGHDDVVVTSTHAGYPVLDGVRNFLRGVHALFAYRDFMLRETADLAPLDVNVVERWKERLRGGDVLGEKDALALLSDFGVSAALPSAVSNEDELIASAAACGYPVVLKTARPGLLHKTDRGGVIVGIQDEEQLRAMYALMRNRLGDRVLLAPMVASGVEMILGLRRDPQFGPVVIIGSGGVHAETLADVQFALPPFDAAHARRCVDRLKLRPLLDGTRGAAAVNIEAFCELASQFSIIADALRDVVQEFDINPVIVNDAEAVAVDALVAGATGDGRTTSETMQTLEIYQSLWGMELRHPARPERSKEEAFAMIAEAGFDGACLDPSVDEIADCRFYAHLFGEHNLGCMMNAFPAQPDDMRPLLDFAVELDACMVNVISGVMPIKPEDAVADVRRWIGEAGDRDMPLLFETHRDGLLNDLYFTLQLMELVPEMRLCADLSHFVVDRELRSPVPARDEAYLQSVLRRSDCFQGRIANREQVQVPINFVQHQEWVELFKGWWTFGMREWRKRNADDARLVFLCELGPPPYAITDAEQNELSDRWQESLQIMGWVKDIWSELDEEG